MSINSKIKLLPEHIIDQIKAGEVIERPASLIKETIENSIDAGASKIDLHIVENGLNLIHLRDNGHGMSYEDLPYAFCRHATSKIERFEDLYRLKSFGFRGEALASISSISRLTCTSVPQKGESGGKIIIQGGQVTTHEHFKDGQYGTNLYIKDLFYNTPARLKFIKSKTSEKNAINKIFTSFVITNPQVSFSIKWDDKEKTFFPKVEDNEIEKRYQKVFFKRKSKDSSDKIIHFKGEYEDHIIEGSISLAASKGNSGKAQFLFANNRFFQDKAFHQSIIKGAEKIWRGMSGQYIVKITAPPSKLDVNVHPNKTEIKFFKQSIIFSLINATIKRAIDKEIELKEIPGPDIEQQTQNNLQQHLIPATDHEVISNFSHSPFENLTYGEKNYSESSNITLSRHQGSILDNENNNNQENIWQQVGENHFFRYDGKASILVNSKKAIQLFLKDKISLCPAYPSEESLIPLLISEPFEASPREVTDLNLKKFKTIGLEFDRLNEKVLALRTIPEAFENEDLTSLIPLLLKYSIQNDEKEIFDFNKEIHFQFDIEFIKEILSQYKTSDLIEKEIAVILNDNHFNNII